MIEQRSPEWFKQRIGLVTGSSVGAILGCDPFRKPKDVLRAMVRQFHNAESEFTGNIATEYGTKFESFAQADFEMETGLNVTETGFHISSEYEWLGASPDGLVDDGAVLEIKCPYGKRNGSDFKSMIEQPQYYAQMQIEMLATGRNKCHFYQWSSVGSSLETIDFSQIWIDENIPKLKKFHDKYLAEIKKPDLHLIDLVQTREAKQLAQVFNDTKAEMDRLKTYLEELRQQLIILADGQKSNISGVLVYPIERKGSIQYKSIPELQNVDLEQYRGKPTKSWGVK